MRTLVLLSLLSAPAFAQSNANGAAPPAPVSTPDAMPAPSEKPPETPSDAPKTDAAPAPAPTATPAPKTENAVSLADHKMPSMWLQAGAGGVAGLISVPISAYLAGWLGSLSNNAYVGLVPWALVMAFLPSLAVTAAVVGIGNYYLPGAFPFWRVWGMTSVASIIALIIGVELTVSVGSFVTVLLYALCDAIAMTAVATPTARWLATPKNGAALASLERWNPGAEQRWFVPTAQVSF